MIAIEIEQMLIKRIQEGIYHIDGQLPPVRELARELEVDKNTVNQAYKFLAQKGYIETIRGSGTYVRSIQPRKSASLDASRWPDQLEQLFIQAKQQAISREEVLREISKRIDQIYGTNNNRFAFIECNATDIETLGHKLNAAFGPKFEGMLLSDFVAQPEEVANRFDLVVTTFFHLGEVNSALQPALQKKVVGVHATPTSDALLKLSRLNVHVIGAVAEFPRAMDWLIHLIYTYQPSVTVLQAPINDEERLQAVLDKADAIVITQSRRPLLPNHRPQVPVIPLSLTIDQQSIDYLQSQIEALTNPL